MISKFEVLRNYNTWKKKTNKNKAVGNLVSSFPSLVNNI